MTLGDPCKHPPELCHITTYTPSPTRNYSPQCWESQVSTHLNLFPCHVITNHLQNQESLATMQHHPLHACKLLLARCITGDSSHAPCLQATAHRVASWVHPQDQMGNMNDVRRCKTQQPHFHTQATACRADHKW